jgi:hypothetical protein
MEHIKKIDSKSAFIVYEAPAGFHAQLVTNVLDVDGAFWSSTDYAFFIRVSGNKGKWSNTFEGSIADLKKSISKEITRLEKKDPHLRPKQVRRLELLRAVV